MRLLIPERKIRHIRKGFRKSRQRNAKSEHRLSTAIYWHLHQIREQELPYSQIGLVFLESLICVALSLDARSVFFDLFHRRHVRAEVALQGGVHGRVVDGDESGVVLRLPEGEDHGDFGAHGVADESWRCDFLGVQEVFYILRHGSVGVDRGVWTCAVVAQVERVDAATEVFC